MDRKTLILKYNIHEYRETKDTDENNKIIYIIAILHYSVFNYNLGYFHSFVIVLGG